MAYVYVHRTQVDGILYQLPALFYWLYTCVTGALQNSVYFLYETYDNLVKGPWCFGSRVLLNPDPDQGFFFQNICLK
jgi:hypothetical protein